MTPLIFFCVPIFAAGEEIMCNNYENMFNLSGVVSENCPKDVLNVSEETAEEKIMASKLFPSSDLSLASPGQLFAGRNYLTSSMSSLRHCNGSTLNSYAVNFESSTGRRRNAGEVKLTLGVCLPKTCTEEHFANWTGAYLNCPDQNLTLAFVSARRVQNAHDFSVTSLMLFLWILTVISFIAYIAGTYRSVSGNWRSIKLKSVLVNGTAREYIPTDEDCESGTSVQKEGTIFESAMKCYDLQGNLSELFSRKKDKFDFQQVHGIRSLSMVYVACVNGVFYFCDRAENVGGLYSMDAFFTEALESFTIGADTFFALSGFLLSYNFFSGERERRSRDTKEPTALCRLKFCSEQIAKKYFRFTPTYIISILVTTFIYESVQNYSPIWLSERNDLNCKIYWWRNLLYINNLYAKEELCMSWSWYIAAEMQFYILSIVICAISTRYFKTAVGLLLVMLSACLGTSAVYSFYKTSRHDSVDSDWRLYSPMHVHFGAYISGLFLGYFLVILNGRWIKIQKSMLILCWLSCALISLTTVSGIAKGRIHSTVPSIYVTFCSSAWGLGVCWTLCACFNGNGGALNYLLTMKIWRVFAKISFVMYLVSPTLLTLFYVIIGEGWRLSFFGLILSGFSYLLFCCAVSFALTVLYDVPLKKLSEQIFASKPGSSRETLHLMNERF